MQSINLVPCYRQDGERAQDLQFLVMRLSGNVKQLDRRANNAIFRCPSMFIEFFTEIAIKLSSMDLGTTGLEIYSSFATKKKHILLNFSKEVYKDFKTFSSPMKILNFLSKVFFNSFYIIPLCKNLSHNKNV